MPAVSVSGTAISVMTAFVRTSMATAVMPSMTICVSSAAVVWPTVA